MANFTSISSLASIVNMFAGSDPVKAQLLPLDSNGSEIDNQQRAFQYFPSEINDSKGANYASKNIPGGSHPLYQFINGSDRTLSLTAIFTSDEDPATPDLLNALQGGLELSLKGAIGAVGSIIGGQVGGALQNSGSKKHVAPPASAAIWLRSFIYPRYTNFEGGDLGTVAPPPVVRFYLPNSGVHGSSEGGQLVVDSVDCLMMQCDIVYDAFYRNGTQRITTVNITLNETVQTGKENWKFADGAALTRAWVNGSTTKGSKIAPYPLKTKGTPPDTSAAAAGGVAGQIASVVGVNLPNFG